MSETCKCGCGEHLTIQYRDEIEWHDARVACPDCGRCGAWAVTTACARETWNADRLAEQMAREALERIAAWQFDIQGDCVADAQAAAREALALMGKET